MRNKELCSKVVAISFAGLALLTAQQLISWQGEPQQIAEQPAALGPVPSIDSILRAQNPQNRAAAAQRNNAADVNNNYRNNNNWNNDNYYNRNRYNNRYRRYREPVQYYDDNYYYYPSNNSQPYTPSYYKKPYYNSDNNGDDSSY